MGFVLPSCVLYLLATLLLVRAVAPDAAGPTRAWRLPALLAIALHGGYHLWVAWRTPGGPDMHFFAALSLVSLGMAAMTALVARGRMAAVGVVSFPLAALLLAVYHGYGHRPSSGLDWRLQLHAWLALLSLSLIHI